MEDLINETQTASTWFGSVSRVQKAPTSVYRYTEKGQKRPRDKAVRRDNALTGKARSEGGGGFHRGETKSLVSTA